MKKRVRCKIKSQNIDPQVLHIQSTKSGYNFFHTLRANEVQNKIRTGHDKLCFNLKFEITFSNNGLAISSLQKLLHGTKTPVHTRGE
jgi:hypothetical protein